jgi:hypothetical protein
VIADGGDRALGGRPAVLAQPDRKARVPRSAAQLGDGLRRRVERDPVIGRVVLAVGQVAANAADRQRPDAAIGGEQPRRLAGARVIALCLGVVLVGQHSGGCRRRAGVDAHDVHALARVVLDADHDRLLAPFADPDASGEQASGLDRGDVRQPVELRHLLGGERQRLHGDGDVWAATGRRLLLHRLLHHRGHGEDADARHRQRERQHGEERARLAARQVRDGLSDNGGHDDLLTPQRRRRGSSRRVARGRRAPCRA